MQILDSPAIPPQLSLIVPFGTSAERPYIDERVASKSKYLRGLAGVEVIFVEGFSSKPNSALKEQLVSDGHSYYYDREQIKFSQGMCRNVGAQNAKSPVLFFVDVDYHISRQMLERVLVLAEVMEIAANTGQFLILPCAFLSEGGTNYLYTQPQVKWDALVQNDFISGQNRLIRFFAPASSAMVVNRHKFLELGGNDKSFIGHSYEDFDLMMRYLKASANFAYLPKEMSHDSRSWNFIEYKGFRALFALTGFDALLHGICLYHLYHPEPNNNGYLDNQETNRNKFYHNLEEVKNMRDFPQPLPSHEAANRRTLLFTRDNSSCHSSLRGATPYLGELVCRDEAIFFDGELFSPELLESFIANQGITTILFPNPYGNAKRKEIYDYARANNIPYLCYDRGALPDSWFFDKQGFNFDSGSYAPAVWDHPLTADEEREILAYISQIKSSNSFLEKQGARLNPEELKTSLGVKGKKIIFIPLQVRDDSVIRYFTEPPFDYDGFLEIADRLAAKLAVNYIFLAKKHPLSRDLDKSKYPNLKFVPDETNLGTLLEACNAILTINSGVGVYAMLHEKPCLVCGNAFYQFEGLNTRIHSEADLERKLMAFDFTFSREKLLRFIHYLVNNFYSFGKSSYKEVLKQERIFRAVNYIDYYRINIGGVKHLEAKDATRHNYHAKSLAYRFFGIDSSQTLLEKGNANLLTGDTRKRLLFVCDGEDLANPNAASVRLQALARSINSTYRLELYCVRSHLADKNVLTHLGQFYDQILLDRDIKHASVWLAKQIINDGLFPPNWLEERAASTFFGFLQKTETPHSIIYSGLRVAWLAKSAPSEALKILDIGSSINAPYLHASEEANSQLFSLQRRVSLFTTFNSVLVGLREEAERLQSILPQSIFIALPSALAIQNEHSQSASGICQFGFVSSDRDRANIKSIQWFIENVWKVMGKDAILHIYGSICSKILFSPKNVILHGVVDELENIYETCDVMINPLICGSEVRTKTVEALAHGKPLLSSPAGARGFTDHTISGIYLAGSRGEFIQGAMALQGNPALRAKLAQNAALAAAKSFAPDQAVAPLATLLEEITS